jgi:hypothetical protein
LPNTCLSQLLSDPQSSHIRPLQYHCSGKMQHVSAFCLLLILFLLLSDIKGLCYGSAVWHGYSAVLCDTVYIGIW